MTRLFFVAAAPAVVFVAFASGAAADDQAEADALKAKGDEAFDGKRWGESLDHYRAAYAKGKSPLLHYNIAQALTFLERYPEALESYQRFLAEAPPGKLNEAQQQVLFKRLEDLKARITRVEVKCAIKGARVLVRDRVIGEVPLAGPVSVNAGSAKIEVLADGYRSYVATVVLEGGTTQTIDAKLERIDFSGVLSITSPVVGATVEVDGTARGSTPIVVKLERGTHVVVVRAPDYASRSESVHVEAGDKKELSVPLGRAPDYKLAYVGFGLGGVGLGAGAITGVLALGRFDRAKSNCDTSAKECGPAGQADLRSARTYGILSTVAFGVGAAGVAIGVYGLLTAKGASVAAPVTVALAPGGLLLLGSF